MIAEYERRHFTADEFNKMVEAGILVEDDHVELIEGEIVQMSPVGKHHVACVNRVSTMLHEALGRTAIVSVQNPIDLDPISQPEPDICVLAPRDDFYTDELSKATDVLLLIEVSDTTAKFDRLMKVPLYAQASILEVWIIDLQEDIIEIYSDPAAGAYRQRRRANRGQSVTPQALPQFTVEVDTILGPSASSA